MAKRTLMAMYYAEDKDVYDLLSSAKKMLSVAALQKIARERGTFISGQDPRNDIVNYLSRLDFDWSQVSGLVEATETAERPEKISGSDIKSKAKREDLLSAAKGAMAAILETSPTDVIQVAQTANGVRISVTYSEPNYTRTRLHQRRIRDLTITVEKAPGGFRVRHEANTKADAVVEALVAALKDVAPDVERREIAMTGIRDAHLRTKFFIQMMNGVAGFKLDTVTSMKVATLPPERSLDDDDEDDDDDEGGSSRAMRAEEAAVVGHVTRAALNGIDLLQSEEYVALAKKGFFLSKCIWWGSEKKGKGRVAEFEAEFSKGDLATGFKYNVRSVRERDEAGELLPTKVLGKHHPDLMEALEDAAHLSLNAIEKEATGKED